MKKLKNQFRQGDVLLQPIADPKTTPEIDLKKDGRTILAFGEVTGHHHEVVSRGAIRFFQGADLQRILEVDAAARLTHQEHSEIAVPRGRYQHVQQREYSPAGIQNVAD